MQRTYAYCPNPNCKFVAGGSGMTGSYCYVTQVTKEAKDEQSCPHCGTALKRACPNCNRQFYERPQRFCPACGQNLLEVKQKRTCEVCGRPFYYSGLEGEAVSICSEGCLSVFIQQRVKTCDQCGTRFKVEPGKYNKLVGLQLVPDGSSQLDFCTEACLEAYQAKLKLGRGRNAGPPAPTDLDVRD